MASKEISTKIAANTTYKSESFNSTCPTANLANVRGSALSCGVATACAHPGRALVKFVPTRSCPTKNGNQGRKKRQEIHEAIRNDRSCTRFSNTIKMNCERRINGYKYIEYNPPTVAKINQMTCLFSFFHLATNTYHDKQAKKVASA